MRIYTILLLSLCLFSMPSMALDVSPDGPKMVQLSEDASSVIVGNPAHATVVIDNPRLLMITAGVPGMTKLIVLGKKGQVILDETVIVNGASRGFIRVKNACINGGEACQPTKMFYCDGGKPCHNVIVNEPTVSGGGSSAGSGTATAGVAAVGGAVDAALEE